MNIKNKRKKLLILLTTLLIISVSFLTFSETIGDWRRILRNDNIPQSGSHIKIDILRDGAIVDSITSTLTNSLNSNGFPDDLVTVPPTINALVGDTIRIKDLSAPTPGAWDFQKYYNGSPYFTQQFFYGNSPFPYEETVTKTGDYTFYFTLF